METIELFPLPTIQIGEGLATYDDGQIIQVNSSADGNSSANGAVSLGSSLENESFC